MSGRSTALAWMGLGTGAVALGLAGALLHRTLRPTLEIRRYADDIAATAQRIAHNTDVAAEVQHLRGLAARVRGGAGAAP